MRRLLLLLPIALGACATTGTGGGDVAIETVSQGQPLPGASCAVTTNSGNWDIITPVTLSVGPANGDLRIVCGKEGYRTSEMVFRPNGSGYASPSVGVGVGGGSGNVGVGLGLSLPVRLGQPTYPGRVTVVMSPQ